MSLIVRWVLAGCNKTRTNAPEPPETGGADAMLQGFVAFASGPMVRPIPSIGIGPHAGEYGGRSAGEEARFHRAHLVGAARRQGLEETRR